MMVHDLLYFIAADIPNMRIPGVLQRFAVAYLVVTLLQWAFHKTKADITTRAVVASSGIK